MTDPSGGGRSSRARALVLVALFGSAACTGPAAQTGGGGAGTPPATARPTAPRAGTRGIGDPYFPDAGNGGYDALHYELALDVAMPAGSLEATAEVRCKALQDLSSFDLDLVGLDVGSVRVDGADASFTRDGRELVITPAAPLRANAEFVVRIAYSGTPQLAADPSVPFLPGVGWWVRDSGVYVMSECLGAASWFPCDDHPRDKATYGITIDVPDAYRVASNGTLLSDTTKDGRRTEVWRCEHPMATYLACVQIARFAVETSTGPHGLPLRLYHPEDATEEDLAGFAKTGEMIELFEREFGPYPFETCGGILTPEQLGGALETQTSPTYSRHTDEATIAHELAHQWFGDCVTVASWKDLWLSEGFASYAEWLWREHEKGPEALERAARGSYRSLRRRGVKAPYDPGPAGLFSSRTYGRGAFVLHMLRREVGDETFFGILHAWVERFHDANADTAAFVQLCQERAGRDLTGFFATWLYGDEIPVLPEYEPPAKAGTGAAGAGDGGERDDQG